MSTPISLNQPSREVILALINRDNGSSLTFEEVTFDPPVANPPAWVRNTTVTVRALDGSSVTGTRDVYYDRLDLGVQFSRTIPVVVADYLNTTHDALPYINEAYNLQLSEEDIIEEFITGNSHTFKAAPTSYVWLGEVTFNILPVGDDNDISLAEDIIQPVLDGFIYGDELVDLNQSPRDALIDLINLANMKTYNPQEITFSQPMAGNFTSGKNTSVTVMAVGGGGYKGSRTVYYDRITFDDMFGNDKTLPSGEYTSTHQLIPVINNRFGVQIEAEDIEDLPIELEDGEGTATLRATVNSYLLRGELTVGIGSSIVAGQITGFDDQPLTGFDGEPITFFDAE